MTITSFDNGIPNQFYKQDLTGRLMIFLRYVMCRVKKRELMSRELDKISFMANMDNPNNGEVYYDGDLVGYIKLIPATKDFIFKQ